MRCGGDNALHRSRDCGAQSVKCAKHNCSTQRAPNNLCVAQQFSCSKFRRSGYSRVEWRRAAVFLPEYVELIGMALVFADAVATCAAARSRVGEVSYDVTEVLFVADSFRVAAHARHAALYERRIGGAEAIERLCSSPLRKR